jgi:hypothetical protein
MNGFECVAPGYWIREDRLGAVELWRDGRQWWIGVTEEDDEYLPKAAGPYSTLTGAMAVANDAWCLKDIP